MDDKEYYDDLTDTFSSIINEGFEKFNDNFYIKKYDEDNTTELYCKKAIRN